MGCPMVKPKFGVGDEVHLSDWYFNEFGRDFFRARRDHAIVMVEQMDVANGYHGWYRYMFEGCDTWCSYEDHLTLINGPW